MSKATKNVLIEKFKELDIQLSPGDEIEISRWFCINNENIEDFLNAIITSVNTSDNVLIPQEEEIYKDLQKQKKHGLSLLTEAGDEDESIEDLRETLENLELEMEFMEKDLLHKNKILKIRENLKEHCKPKLNKLAKYCEEQELEKKILNEKSNKAISDLEHLQFELLEEFEWIYASMKKIEEKSDNTSLYNLNMKVDFLTKCEDEIKKYKKNVQNFQENLFNNDDNDDIFYQKHECFVNKLYKKMKSRISNRIQEKQLEAFLIRKCNLKEDAQSYQDRSQLFLLTKEVMDLREEIEKCEVVLDSKLRRAAKETVDKKLIGVKTEQIIIERRYLNDLKKFHQNYLMNILSDFYLLLLATLKRNENIQKTSTIYDEVLKYTVAAVKKSEKVTENMQTVTDKFGDYENLSTEKHYQILEAINTFVPNNNDQNHLLIKQYHKSKDISKRLSNFESYCLKLTQFMRELIKQLYSEHVSRPIYEPPNLVQMMNRFNKLQSDIGKKLITQKNSYGNVSLNLKKNHWLASQRLLWIYYLRDPDKLKKLLEELNIAVNIHTQEQLRELQCFIFDDK